ncbi:Large proline-rich protein bag6 [Lamellibrachia satsuma]|nr:Large proline-rich protein bag6 [Lamellibrachia satsuma]
MLDVTVKTLDGKNRSFSVPDDILVTDFKLRIAPSVEISADTQRLIFQGRVLQDDKKLNEYDVNGKTLHIVQRPPPLAPSTGTTGRSTTTPTTSANGGRRTMSGQVSTSANVIVGSLGIPQDAIDPAQVQSAVQQALSASGIVGPGQNILVQTRISGDGSSVDARINLGPAPVESESQNRLNMVRRMISGATRVLNRLEHPNSNGANTAQMDTSLNGDRPSTSTESGTARVVSPMDTSATPLPPEGRSGASTTPPPDGRPGARTTESTGTTDQGRPQHPAPPALAELLSDVFDVNHRLQPHLARYHDLLQRDPLFTADEGNDLRARQAECDLVAEAIHYLSHTYHNISDVMMNLSQAPPRQLRAAPVPMLPPGVFMQHVPAQAHINLLRPGTMPSNSDSTSSAVPVSVASGSASNASTGAASSLDSTTQTAAPRQMPPTGGPAPQPVGTSANSQPYVFMEVGPQSVSISSVTSHVVDGPAAPITQSTAGTTTTNVCTGTSRNTQHTSTTQSTQPGQPHAGAGPRPTGLGGMQLPEGLRSIGSMLGGSPSFMPPDLLQNIIHMATNAAVQSHAGHQVIIVTQEGDTPPTQTPSSTTNTTSSSSATTTARQGGSDTPTPSSSNTAVPSSSGTTTVTGSSGRDQPHRATLLIPGPPPGGHGIFRPPGAELVEPVDPYLQCHSRFFLGQRHPEGAHTGPEGVGGMVSNLLSSVFSQHQHAHAMSHQQHQQQSSSTAPQGRPEPAGHVPPPIPASNPFASLLQSLVRQPVPGAGPSAGPRPGAGPFRVQFQNIQPQAPRANTSTPHGTAPPRPAAPGGGGAVLSDEIFGQLVQGIGSHLSQAATGQQSSETIADFLHNLGQGYNISPGEGMLSDLFMCVSQHLTFIDLMSVFFGNPQPLQSLRTPLQQFMHEHVLHGNQPTVENIDQAVARILDDMRDDINATCADVTARDDINFNMTLTRFLRQQLTITIRMIVNVPGDDQHFGRDLCERLRRVIHEFVVLSQYCLVGGREAVERMVQNRLAIISSDVTPMIQQWMTGMTLQQLRQLMPSITISSNDILHYVVRRGSELSDTTSVTDMTQRDHATQVNMPVTVASCQTEAMDTDPEATGVSAAVAVEDELQEDLEEEDETRPPKPNIPKEVLDCLAPPPTKESDDIAVVLGSEDWHRAVPSEWVPVITRDVRRQTRQSQQSQQAGFSEAYISGMPAKRRKMMSQESGEGMNSNDSNSTNSASHTSS